MSRIYRRILRQRLDMTEWLLHFTRNRDRVTARDNLLSIAREGLLRSGWAPRGGRNTIYGPHPAVCFSEQPIWAFLEYLDARNDPSAMSGYGVFVHKNDVFGCGGLPVVYGLAGTAELERDEEGYEEGKRILRKDCLPFAEQYRFVALNPNHDPYPIDWSHEREWRWTAVRFASWQIDGAFPLEGSRGAGPNGSSEGRTHFLVEFDADVAWLRKELRPLVEARTADKSSERAYHDYRWCEHLATRVRIVSLETLRDAETSKRLTYPRIESLPPEMFYDAFEI